MNQTRTVNRIFAVIPGVVMTAGNIDAPLVRERIKAGRDILQTWGGVTRVVRIIFRLISEEILRVEKLRIHRRNLRGCGVAPFMRVASERNRVLRAATLVIEAKRKSSGELCGHPAIDAKRK